MKKIFYLLLGSMIFWACPGDPEFNNQIVDVGEVNGMKPIYSSSSDWQLITAKEPVPMVKPGKIYYKNGLLFVNEKFKGVHIIDNSDPTHPEKIKFIEIVGNKDISIKGDRLYADNYTDLVTLDISDLNNITVLSRLKDIYPKAAQAYPEAYEGYFECVNNSLGIVVGWEEAVLMNPECWK
ncbi:MAG: hypothetical protein KDC85_15050 [Saprospiraceae bacterium]|nr:hypothetical protein [Saprospiraceae bacterium]MCB9323072.1 hypothetical protein [Lewinellaceae bacterium]